MGACIETQPHNCATRSFFRLVRQIDHATKKMGKKCFCRTMKFSPQNFSPQKHLALTGIQLQSRIKKHVSQVFVGLLFLPLRCTKLAHIKEKSIMMIVTARDFRGEQGKILARAARGEDVVITSRDHGSFRIVPITEDDTLISKDKFFERLKQAEEEISEGWGKTFTSADEAIAYFQTI